jgi:hypothetical protein
MILFFHFIRIIYNDYNGEKGIIMDYNNYKEWRIELQKLQKEFEEFDNNFEFDGTEETYQTFKQEREVFVQKLEAHYQLEKTFRA